MNSQIKSKERVADHGEVYTSDREVNNMLDLVKQETERLDSRFLEPACGHGNFLVEVLRRKMNVLVSRHGGNRYEFEKHSVVVISSIYGIDILADNVEETRNRLYNYFKGIYSETFKGLENDKLLPAIRYLLNKNMIHGDALSLKKTGSEEPIVFCEWNLTDNNIKRKDFTFEELLKNRPIEGLNLFSALGENAFVPRPIQEYPPIHFLDIPRLC